MKYLKSLQFDKIWSLIIFLLFIVTGSGWCQQSRHRIELKHFKMQSSDIIKANGQELSSGKYQSRDDWFPVKVPSTVLAGLVANKVYPSPYFGMNNMRIPDASDAFDSTYHLFQYSYLPNKKNPWKDPYWYRTQFKLPQSYKGKHVWLTFKGINYRAAVWVNGQQIADTSKMVGMFAQYHFDVTKAVHQDGKNYMAVEIYPLDYPGLPAPPQLKALGPFYKNGGPNGDIGKNVTMLCSIGWDWVPAARGREMGIWLPVYLSASGSVTINQPHIITSLPDLPDTTHATVKIQTLLENHSEHIKRGQLQVVISPHNFHGAEVLYTQNEAIKAHEKRSITLSPRKIRALRIDNPHLWWPNGQGKANLYELKLRFVSNGTVSDASNTVFGIRTISSKVTEDHKGWPRRDFYINGRKIHLDGGAWVPDLMLKRDSTHYAQELGLIKNDHLNLVRIWGGGIAPPDDFFKVADEDGLLVWQDFWITGDTQGGFKGSPNWPLQGDVFIRNMKNTIIRLRNHPSLLLWTGGNEGHPRKDLYDAIRQSVAKLDGTRPFIPSSSGFDKLPKGWKGSWPDNKEPGFYSGGPYSWQNPVNYFNFVNNGRTVHYGGQAQTIYDWTFKDETGIPSQPTYNSLRKIIPDLVPDTTLPFPLNNTWGYHDACAGNGGYQTYYNAIVDRYGKPRSIRDYSTKAQLINANDYRAIFEAAGSKLNKTGGVMLWKLNAAWPSVVWQIYDWYLEPNAGYYYIQKAVEPLHVQFNLDDSTVVVVNRKYQKRSNLNVHIRVFNAQSKVLYKQDKKVTAGEHQVTPVLSLKNELAENNELNFVELSVTNQKGELVSHNFYWLAPDNKFESLSKLPNTKVDVWVDKVAHAKVPTWKVHIKNPTDKLAFFIRTQLMKDHGKKEVLPSFWSGNYVNLAPHESMTLTVHCDSWKNVKKAHHIKVSGWNLSPELVGL